MEPHDIPSHEGCAQKQEELESRCQVNGEGTHGHCCHPVLSGVGPAPGAPPSLRQVLCPSHPHTCRARVEQMGQAEPHPRVLPTPAPTTQAPFTLQSTPSLPPSDSSLAATPAPGSLNQVPPSPLPTPSPPTLPRQDGHTPSLPTPPAAQGVPSLLEPSTEPPGRIWDTLGACCPSGHEVCVQIQLLAR